MPPAVSTRLRKLAEYLGVVLYDAPRRKVTLTVVGWRAWEMSVTRFDQFSEFAANLRFAHLLEHVAFAGGARYDRAAIRRFTGSEGIVAGADINGLTSYDRTCGCHAPPSPSRPARRHAGQVRAEVYVNEILVDD